MDVIDELEVTERSPILYIYRRLTLSIVVDICEKHRSQGLYFRYFRKIGNAANAELFTFESEYDFS
jgi:hypothetical protein